MDQPTDRRIPRKYHLRMSSMADHDKIITEGVFLGFSPTHAVDWRVYRSLDQCYKCLKRTNHVSYECDQTRRCVVCGETHERRQCFESPQCANCGGAHKAWSHICPDFLVRMRENSARFGVVCPTTWNRIDLQSVRRPRRVFSTFASSLGQRDSRPYVAAAGAPQQAPVPPQREPQAQFPLPDATQSNSNKKVMDETERQNLVEATASAVVKRLGEYLGQMLSAFMKTSSAIGAARNTPEPTPKGKNAKTKVAKSAAKKKGKGARGTNSDEQKGGETLVSEALRGEQAVAQVSAMLAFLHESLKSFSGQLDQGDPLSKLISEELKKSNVVS